MAEKIRKEFCFLRSHRFWKVVLIIFLPVVTVVAVLSYMNAVVGQVRLTAHQYVLEGAVMNINVFLDNIERQNTTEEDFKLRGKNVVVGYIERYDNEYGINCLVLNEDLNIISERAETDFVNPFDFSVDSDYLNSVLSIDQDRGYFEVEFTTSKGRVLVCDSYYRTINLDDEIYFIIVGIQPDAISKAVNVEGLYLSTFLFGLVIIASLWVIAFTIACSFNKFTKMWKEDCTDERPKSD